MEHGNSIYEYLHTTVHTGCLSIYENEQVMYFDQRELLAVQSKAFAIKGRYKAMSDKLFLLEAVLFLIYLALLWISVLALSHVPSLIVLIRIQRVVVVMSECCLFLLERRIRKRLHILERKASL